MKVLVDWALDDRNIDQIPHDLAEGGCPECGAVYVEALEKRESTTGTAWVVACYLGHRVHLQLGTRATVETRESVAKALQMAIGAVAGLNEMYCRTHTVPPLYKSGVRYSPEVLPSEAFAVIPEVENRGFGDADDLVAWRVAELRASGEEASIRICWTVGTSGQRIYTVQVRRANGTIEDPAEILKSLEGRR